MGFLWRGRLLDSFQHMLWVIHLSSFHRFSYSAYSSMLLLAEYWGISCNWDASVWPLLCVVLLPSLSLPVDIIWTMMIVWRITGKIIRTVLCCVVYNSCTEWYAHTWAVLKDEWWFRFRFSCPHVDPGHQPPPPYPLTSLSFSLFYFSLFPFLLALSVFLFFHPFLSAR